ncbi:MAG: hypothetical protein P1U40_06990 [Coxiellaceae bacterium]|nr:hypothetical protein [Coxiellaceae bacterium]
MNIKSIIAGAIVLTLSAVAMASNPPDGNKTAYNIKLFTSDNDKAPAKDVKQLRCGKGQVQASDPNGQPTCVVKPAPQQNKSSSWW